MKPLKRRDLYDVLACPVCKAPVDHVGSRMRCGACAREFPVVDGVPIMMADGAVPEVEHDSDLVVWDTYLPSYYRLVIQSLLDDQVVVEIGAGDRAISDPAIIRTDVKLTPHVDVVADAHALPFLPGSVDFIFSTAVLEHLRHPFVAAAGMYEALKDGGYVFGDCAWVFAYHGFPHNYFNSSVQGLQQLFGSFRELRSGVTPNQMPSFALEMVLATYLGNFNPDSVEGGHEFAAMLAAPLHKNLAAFDRGFTEEGAAMVAAGTFFLGVKQLTEASSCFPEAVMDAWRNSPELQQRFPDPVDLSRVDNLLTWARNEGAETCPAIREHVAAGPAFAKHGDAAPYDRSAIRSIPVTQPGFGSVYDDDEFGCIWRQPPPPQPGPDPEPQVVNVVGWEAEAQSVSGRAGRAATLWRTWRHEGTKATSRKVARKILTRQS